MVCCLLTAPLNWLRKMPTTRKILILYITYVCNVVEEVDTFPIVDLQSENNDAKDEDGRSTRDAQSDPEYEPEGQDQEDGDSSEEDANDSQKLDVTFQPPPLRKTVKSKRYASKTYGKSPSLNPISGTTNPHKKSKTHIDDKEFSSARPVSCPICHKQFESHRAKDILKRHLNIHAPEPEFPCPHCPAKFNHQYNRQRHIQRFHLKVKRFACQFCTKKFVTRYNQRQHEMVRNITTTDFAFFILLIKL
jgi:hypothetical protein